MELIFVRHAHAGERTSGLRDRYRPLSDRGLEQARLISKALDDYDVVEILSSPASRCVQTVAPLAESRGLTVVEDEALWETSTDDDVAECLIRSLTAARSGAVADNAGSLTRPTALVMCSHGNIIPPMVERAATLGATVHGRGCERGSMWILHYDGTKATSARYLSPRNDYQADAVGRT